jgi:hypothetical protein
MGPAPTRPKQGVAGMVRCCRCWKKSRNGIESPHRPGLQRSASRRTRLPRERIKHLGSGEACAPAYAQDQVVVPASDAGECWWRSSSTCESTKACPNRVNSRPSLNEDRTAHLATVPVDPTRALGRMEPQLVGRSFGTPGTPDTWSGIAVRTKDRRTRARQPAVGKWVMSSKLVSNPSPPPFRFSVSRRISLPSTSRQRGSAARQPRAPPTRTGRRRLSNECASYVYCVPCRHPDARKTRKTGTTRLGLVLPTAQPAHFPTGQFRRPSGSAGQQCWRADDLLHTCCARPGDRRAGRGPAARG